MEVGKSENENPLSPIAFELRLIHVNRETAEVNLGWSVRETPPGLEIEQVVDESPMRNPNLIAGDFVLSINRSRIRTNAELEDRIKGSPTNFVLVVARRRAAPLDMATFPLPAGIERRAGFDYVICRLDQSSHARTGMKLRVLAGRLAILSIDSQGAAKACGLKVADRIIRVGAAKARDDNHVRRILQVLQGDPVDVLADTVNLGPDLSLDDYDPTLGVPEVPTHSEKLMNSVRAAIGAKPIIKPTSSESKATSGSEPPTEEPRKSEKKRVTILKPDQKQ